MGYAFEDLSERQFELFVIEAAKLELGKGAKGFAAGKDGGRDARFSGVANDFPSKRDPWCGITIIQAKHTLATGVHFSDSTFGGMSKSAVVSVEIERVKKLRSVGQIDNYMLYSNRTLTANTNEELLERIGGETGLGAEHVHLCGLEDLDASMRREPEILKFAGINPLSGPLVVSSVDLAWVIEGLAKQAHSQSTLSRPVPRTLLSEKDRINRMTPRMSGWLMKRYGPLLGQIREFLGAPENEQLKLKYEKAAEDFDLSIAAHRDEYTNFDAVFERIVRVVESRDSVLARNARLSRAVVYYMYWNCDLGDNTEVDEV